MTVVAILVSLLIPPILIGIKAMPPEERTKPIVVNTVLAIILLLSWRSGSKIIFGIILLAITLLIVYVFFTIILLATNKESYRTAHKILGKLNLLESVNKGTLNYFLKELRENNIPNKIKICYRKDIVVLLLSLIKVIDAEISLIIILGSYLYIVIEIVVAGNEGLKSSIQSFMKGVQNAGTMGNSRTWEETQEERGEMQEEEREEDKGFPGDNGVQEQGSLEDEVVISRRGPSSEDKELLKDLSDKNFL